jgi:hypothetical protein
MADYPFGEWLPDLPANNNPGALLVKNCVPKKTSYGELLGLQGFSTALADTARGNFWLRAGAGVVYNFAADADNLYLFDGAGGWANVNKPATVYSAQVWDFVNFQDRVIATDGGGTNLQYFDEGVSATFDDLPGGPPRGKALGVVRDFLMVGNYTLGAEIESGGFAWSGFNNTGTWGASLTTQAGRRRTRGIGGQVQRIVSGTRGIAFRENDILVISYVGPPNVFKFDDLTTQHGTPAARSVCWTKDLVFYYSAEGFYQLNRTSLELSPIGVFKVDEWFKDNAAAVDIVNMQGSVDRTRNLVFWVFRSTGSAATFNRILVYNWASQRWAYAELDVEYIGEFASVGYNLDTIGAVLGGNIDSASISVDSAAYVGGGVSLLGFSPSHVGSTFSGAPLTAEIDTGEFGVGMSKRGYVNGVRPIVDVSSVATIQVAPITRGRVYENPVMGAFVNVNDIGQADMRINARYHRYRVRIAGGFDHAARVELGVDNPLKIRGRR